MPDSRREGGSQEDKHPMLKSEDTKSTGSEENSAVGRSPHWMVAPVWWWWWWWVSLSVFHKSVS